MLARLFMGCHTTLTHLSNRRTLSGGLFLTACLGLARIPARADVGVDLSDATKLSGSEPRKVVEQKSSEQNPFILRWLHIPVEFV